MGAFAETVKKDNSYAAKLQRLRAMRNPPVEKDASDLTPMKVKSKKKNISHLVQFQFKKADEADIRQAAQDSQFRQVAPLSADLAATEGAKRLKAHTHMAYMLGQHLRRARPQNELEKSLGYSPEELQDLESSPGREVVIPMSMGKKADDAPSAAPVAVKPQVPGPVAPTPVATPKQPSLGLRMSGLATTPPAAPSGAPVPAAPVPAAPVPAPKSAPMPPPMPRLVPTPFNNVPIPPELGVKRGGAILDPIKHTMQDTFAELLGALQRRKEDATKITADPSTHPAYYPSLAMNLPKAFQQGFKDEHTKQTGKLRGKVDADLSTAKAEFEAALTGKSDNPELAKIGEAFDKFAECSIKIASGELNQILNGYLGLSTLIGGASFAGGHAWAKKNDKNVQTLKAVKELMRQRAYMQPPVILTDPNSIAGAKGSSQAPVDQKALDVQFEPAKHEASETVNAI